MVRRLLLGKALWSRKLHGHCTWSFAWRKRYPFNVFTWIQWTLSTIITTLFHLSTYSCRGTVDEWMGGWVTGSACGIVAQRWTSFSHLICHPLSLRWTFWEGIKRPICQLISHHLEQHHLLHTWRNNFRRICPVGDPLWSLVCCWNYEPMIH